MEVRVSKLRTVRLLIPALVLAAATGSPLAGMHGGAVQAAPAGPSGGTGAAEAAARRDVPSAVGAGAPLGWSEPFSSSRWSQRQQQYAHPLSGDRLAPPQLVIDGRSQSVGSKRDEVLRQIAAARAQRPAAAVDLAMDAPSR